MNRLLKLVAFLCVFLFANYASGQFYALDPGDGLVVGISDNGIAVGSFQNADNQYFMWQVGAGGKVNIGGVPAGNGVGGQAKISNDGTRIVGSDFNNVSGLHEMSYYDVSSGSWTPVGGIGGSSDASISSGWNISGDGLSLVGLGWVNAGEAHAIHWRNGTMADLGSTSGTDSSRANAVNIDGTVIGGWQDGNGRQGAIWVNGVQELIFDDNQEPAQEVTDLSDDGRFATGLGIGPFFGIGNTFRYDTVSNEHIVIPNLKVGGEQNTSGTSITNDGRVIGGGTWPFATPAQFGDGFVWEEGIGTLSVKDYLTSKGASGWDPDFHFAFVSAMSSDGTWIAGWGNVGGPGNSVSWAVRIPGGPVTVVPKSFDVTQGTFSSGTVADLSASDDMDVSVRRSSTDVQSRTEISLKANSAIEEPTTFEFTLEGSVFARTQVIQFIELFNYDAGEWEQVDERDASRFSDSTIRVAPIGDLSRFVEAKDGCIEARIRYQSTNPRQRFASNTDHCEWTIE